MSPRTREFQTVRSAVEVHGATVLEVGLIRDSLRTLDPAVAASIPPGFLARHLIDIIRREGVN